MSDISQYRIPEESYSKLFLRFLRFGLLAWGGPVAQIAMIRGELVEDEKWITPERFNRVFAVYQALPGPEAHELCVYFGMLSRGRTGAFLAGLGFMLPGFILMFMLSWVYVSYGFDSLLFKAVFLGMQPAVAALILRAAHRIGSHALHDNRWLWGIAFAAGVAQLLGVHFLVTLFIAGIVYWFAQSGRNWLAWGFGVVSLIWLAALGLGFIAQDFSPTPVSSMVMAANTPSVITLLFSGIRSGLLTFGGAYTVIPFLQHDAVYVGGWMTNVQFLDGLALSGLLPAPLIIFSTFVGYIGGGPMGAIVLTIGIFTPAFAFTMLGHDYLERLVENQSIHAFLDGLTAGVVGLISATTLTILSETVIGIHAWLIFSLALIILSISKAKWAIAAVILIAGLFGGLFLRGV